MSVFDTKDLKSEINTIINKGENSMETSNSASVTGKSRKSILKIPSTSFKEIENKKNLSTELLNQSLVSDLIPRPHTLEDFIQKETLVNTELQSTLTLNDLSENEELWIVDVPRTIDPLQLRGQVLQLGDKSKFKVGEDRYCAINRNSKSSVTCVLSTDKELNTYKTVNIKPAGTISIRRKLSGISKKKLQFEKSEGVPYPKNIKIRHPFFGVRVNEASIKKEKNETNTS